VVVITGPRPTPGTSALVALVALAVGSALVYWLDIAHVYPLRVRLGIPHQTWPPFVDYSLAAGARLALTYLLLMLGYVAALFIVERALQRSARSTIVLIGVGWLVFAAVLLGAYPGESRDVFDYLVRGRMLVFEGASPLATTPSAFPNARFMRYISWRDAVDTYGPLWEYASGATAWLVGASGPATLSRYIIGYRLLAIGLSGMCAVLIWQIVRRSSPQDAPAAVLAWLWNPLVLNSTALGAHNDALMLVCMLLALLLFQRQCWTMGWMALWLAAHVKLTALLLLPVLAVWLVRQIGWQRAIKHSVLALVIALPTSWLLYAPLGGWATLPRMLRERTALVFNSPANLLYHALQDHWNWIEPRALRLVTTGSTLLWALVAALIVWHMWRRSRTQRDDAVLWHAALLVTIAYLLIGSFWFMQWYIVWAIVLAALLPTSRWTRVLLPLYSATTLVALVMGEFLLFEPAHRLAADQIVWLQQIVINGPLLLALAVIGGRRLWRAYTQQTLVTHPSSPQRSIQLPEHIKELP